MHHLGWLSCSIDVGFWKAPAKQACHVKPVIQEIGAALHSFY